MGHHVGQSGTKPVNKKTPQREHEGDWTEAWFIIDICAQTWELQGCIKGYTSTLVRAQ